MADDFSKAVDDGLRLSKRIYFGKDRSVTPPKPPTMEKSSSASFLPASPMVYAVISDPGIVDNPDMPSYQPHVHGRCDPPALIPLQMSGISLEVQCYLDTAFVTMKGSWRVHCVMGSRSCDCRVAIPMGEQGSVLGVEVDISRKSYCTQLATAEDNKDYDRGARVQDLGFLKPHIFTLIIPQVDGGTNLSIKVSWSQKLLYDEDQFSLIVPFSFLEYVTPAGKKISKKEKILLNVNPGTGTEVLCKTSSHPLKELERRVGQLAYSYEQEVLKWSTIDFTFSYSVPSDSLLGGFLLQSPSMHDADQREMFCIYLFPGNPQKQKVFRREVVFVVDISGSMRGKPLEDMKSALYMAFSKLDPEDSFNIIAFNGETYLFSSTMMPATKEAVDNVNEWIGINFVAGGGTNISQPLDQAIEMLSGARSSLPLIFLFTDGSVEDERHICDVMKRKLSNRESLCPRIHTFGIGYHCNHYFLRTLSALGRGSYDAAFDPDLIKTRVQRLFSKASSSILANLSLDTLEDDLDLEVFPSRIPDLLLDSPLVLSGRYQGSFPENIKAKAVLPDMSNFCLNLKAQKTKDIPLDKISAKQQIEILTAQAWFSEDKELEAKVAKMSIQTGFVSEYTCMALLESDKTAEQKGVSPKTDPKKGVDSKGPKRIVLRNLGLGFGNVTATIDNVSPCAEETKGPEAAEIFVKAASNCCGKLCNHCCCMCCIQCCSKINDRCAIVLTQLCSALACFGCFECCAEICCGGQDGR
ncbi:von Willebrand factor, type A [Dillenia turbinata]|uniref:von Willebrand factor, type A n=1 Tax=Dillenia turbinata TaxID=194707 RepID=A0AAN8VUL3_9MAGN